MSSGYPAPEIESWGSILDEPYIASLVLAGVYSFFGVTITDDGLGFRIADDRQPRKGFLRRSPHHGRSLGLPWHASESAACRKKPSRHSL